MPRSCIARARPDQYGPIWLLRRTLPVPSTGAAAFEHERVVHRFPRQHGCDLETGILRTGQILATMHGAINGAGGEFFLNGGDEHAFVPDAGDLIHPAEGEIRAHIPGGADGDKADLQPGVTLHQGIRHHLSLFDS